MASVRRPRRRAAPDPRRERVLRRHLRGGRRGRLGRGHRRELEGRAALARRDPVHPPHLRARPARRRARGRSEGRRALDVLGRPGGARRRQSERRRLARGPGDPGCALRARSARRLATAGGPGRRGPAQWLPRRGARLADRRDDVGRRARAGRSERGGLDGQPPISRVRLFRPGVQMRSASSIRSGKPVGALRWTRPSASRTARSASGSWWRAARQIVERCSPSRSAACQGAAKRIHPQCGQTDPVASQNGSASFYRTT